MTERNQPLDDEMTENDEDRRKYRRVAMPLKARFLTESGAERSCLVVNISAGGALLRAKKVPEEDDNVVLYIDQIGRFEARVIRSGYMSFAVSYERKRKKNAKTADNLTKALNVGQRETNRRKTPRIEQNKPAIIEFEDGRTQDCAILDISLTGASIEISPRPPLGTHIALGRMTAKVVRRHEKGIGVVFTGANEKMEEVLESTVVAEPEPNTGAQVAPSFGKKGASA